MGTGISLIHRNSLKITNIEKDLTLMSNSSARFFESLAVRIEDGKLGINIVVVYRPPPDPNNEFFNQLSDLLDSTDLLRNDTIICGDFNCPGTTKLVTDVRLNNLIRDHNLTQFINTSTRKQDGNILDLVIARPNGVISGIPVLSEVSFSDHNLITFSSYIIRQPAIPQSFTFRDVKNMDTQSFCSILIDSSYFYISTIFS